MSERYFSKTTYVWKIEYPPSDNSLIVFLIAVDYVVFIHFSKTLFFGYTYTCKA